VRSGDVVGLLVLGYSHGQDNTYIFQAFDVFMHIPSHNRIVTIIMSSAPSVDYEGTSVTQKSRQGIIDRQTLQTKLDCAVEVYNHLERTSDILLSKYRILMSLKLPVEISRILLSVAKNSSQTSLSLTTRILTGKTRVGLILYGRGLPDQLS
jgi:hypothetical protein